MDLHQRVRVMGKAPPPQPPPKKPRGKPDAAFDLWLQRGLQEIYGKVTEEAVPEELLRIIEDDRRK